jgi:CHAD domain-containing protein
VNIEKLSYGQLAAARTVPLFTTVLNGLSKINEKARPEDKQLKALRKDMQRLRDSLDMFAFAYGAGGAQEKTWTQLRDQIDDGYEVLGHFKDLFDSQGKDLNADGSLPAGVSYDPAVLEQRKGELLTWAKAFKAPAQLDAFRKLVANPSSTIETIDRRNLSKFFWGGVDFRPKAGEPGVVAVRKLAATMLDKAKTRVDAAKALTDLTAGTNEDTFHNARKQIRSSLNLLKNFPELVKVQKRDLDALDAAVGKFGDIEDRLVAWHLATNSGSTAAAAAASKLIAKDWAALQKELNGGALLKVIQRVEQGL